ncbi:protease inhibitor-like [Tropilaelaps mercedesae]|uniref:Protease inhibitor-like n=1 Tax=Tropilaelaps mercedesae TaxID=418985 RepID=A0A1V9X497_9ACAR|nr:protease inhibitor-like [Tropilaelaps mercedesae]
MRLLLVLLIVALVAALVTGQQKKKIQDKNCALPKDAGPCNERASLKWYYDSKSSKCRRFVYGGCQGNGNRWDSDADCKKKCIV